MSLERAENFVTLEWLAKPDLEYLKDPSAIDRDHPQKVEIGIYPSKLGKIFIHYPGYLEDMNGPSNRYARLVRQYHQLGLGSTLRSGNKPGFNFLPAKHLEKVIEYSLENSSEICGSKDPELNIMGFSAGGSAVAAISSKYKEISKILLMAPSADMPKSRVVEGLGNFKGEVCIMIGYDDEVVERFMGYAYYDFAQNASKKQLFVLEQCDHGFSSNLNEMIYLNAPQFAFADEKNRDLF